MLINELLQLATSKRASDLYLAQDRPPLLRIDGMLQTLSDIAPQGQEAIQRVLETVVPPDRIELFHREKELDISYEVSGLGRCRVNACYQRGVIALSFRLLPQRIPTIEELALPEVCRELISKPKGLILVTGPTGSGKSTTLAAMIGWLNQQAHLRIITIEDPIEFVHPDNQCSIIQRELGSDTHSFATAVRQSLRQNPDVILIGEMRDLETMSAALTAAETGHLVLSTLHTVDAVRTVDRFVSVFPPHQQPLIRMQLSMVLEGVIAQVLLRRASGRGRVAAFEIMLGIPAIRNLIREGKTHQLLSYMQVGRQYKMQTMQQALEDLTNRGIVTAEEAFKWMRE